MITRASIIALLMLGLIFSCYAEVEVGYYKDKCGTHDVESVIKSVVTTRWSYDPNITAVLLRLLFHDCMGNGKCDASLTLKGPYSEQTAPPNYTVKGYDLIETIKEALEQVCPGVVSCSDIIAAAARDAVVLAGGKYFDIPMGRMDGLDGFASNVKLPAPDISVPDAIAYYGKVGFSAFETTVLLGGHTVGFTHCHVIKDRLYNYNGTGKPDPSMNPLYVFFLGTAICQNNTSTDNMFIFLDSPCSVRTFDNSYYKNCLDGKGILPIDSFIAFHPLTSSYVKSLASNNDYFLDVFAKAIVKMSQVGVLTGDQGEIRKECSKTN